MSENEKEGYCKEEQSPFLPSLARLSLGSPRHFPSGSLS